MTGGHGTLSRAVVIKESMLNEREKKMDTLLLELDLQVRLK